MSATHLVSFGMLYLILVQIANAFSDHYKVVGFATTERFAIVMRVSDYLAAYGWVFAMVIAVDLFIVARMAQKNSRWTSAYSHSVLLSVGAVSFLAVCWMITPMVWSRPGAAKPGVANVDPLLSDIELGSLVADRSHR